MSESWGTHLTFSVYVEGEPGDDDVFKATQELDGVLGAHVIGVSHETVRDEPTSQGAA